MLSNCNGEFISQKYSLHKDFLKCYKPGTKPYSYKVNRNITHFDLKQRYLKFHNKKTKVQDCHNIIDYWHNQKNNA